MANERLNEQMVELVSKHLGKIKSLERVALLIFFLGFALLLMKQPNFNIVMIIGALLTSTIYFLLAFSVVEIKHHESTGILNSIGFDKFVHK